MSDFIHLHNHTDYSLLDAAQSIDMMSNRLADIDMDTIAVTEHGNLFSLIPFYKNAIKNGIMLLPEDRKKSGLFFSMSIKENTSLSVLEKIFRLGFIDNKDELTQVKSMNEKVLLQYNSVNDSVDLLSGGNQQKVLLSKCLMNEPKILFLNNPTRGIDVKSKSEIYSLIHSLSQQGTGIILISSELEELIDNCHRIIVMNKGIQSDEYQYGQFSNQKILHSATIA